MCKHENSIGSQENDLRICLDCGTHWVSSVPKYIKSWVDEEGFHLADETGEFFVSNDPKYKITDEESPF